MNREAFEAWMRREYGDISLVRIGTGEYREWFVWRTWQAWRVATNAAPNEAAAACEAEADLWEGVEARLCAARIRALKGK